MIYIRNWALMVVIVLFNTTVLDTDQVNFWIIFVLTPIICYPLIPRTLTIHNKKTP